MMSVSQETPIFIRGLSRSGGTLLVTIWDAHPDVSMSYELYPNLLDSLIGNPDQIEFFRELLGSEKLLKKAYQGEQQKLKIFVARSYRSGLTSADLTNIFEKLASKVETPFSHIEDAMEFISLCAKEKMKKEGKKVWGMKCNGAYPRYLESWPNARFINIVRDGRDVLASQLLTGSFNKSVAEVAEGYISNHTKFAKFMERPDFKGINILYERLVTDSEAVMLELCEFVGLDFSPEMTRYYDKDLTIYKNSMGHLSRDRISKPIDGTQIGRWKKDLSSEQVDEFESMASDVLRQFGYL